MEDKKSAIRELEKKNRADEDDRRRLLTQLGGTLFERIGEGEPFPEYTGETPGGLLAEYRKMQHEIAESEVTIKSRDANIRRLKDLEEEISGKEAEHSRLGKELEDANIRLGKALLEASPGGDFDGPLKQQEEILLEKISEQEIKLNDLERQEGGIISWLGKSAKSAVSKGMLLKHRSALQRLYRGAGEKHISSELRLEGEAGAAAEKVNDLKEQLSALAVNLGMLKGERRNIGELFGDGGSPARRIQGQEKHIAHVKGEFPAVCLRLGSLADKSEGTDALSSILNGEDRIVLERTGIIISQIAERELGIKKLTAAIGIDDENAEIEKTKKAIEAQRQKISAAEQAIAGFEKHIAESEQHIGELNTFIQENGGL
jgi:hypothetical protein